jgi:hypothetical protein
MKRKTDKKGRSKGSLSDFVAIERYIMRSTAWRALSPVARAVYSEVGYHYTGENNGRIVISVRGIAASLGISKDTAGRALQVLEEHGFIETVKRGAFNMKQRHASEFRMTAFRCDVTGALPSKKFMRWEPEIQNTVRPQGPNGTTTGTDGTKATRNYPSRSFPSDCQSPFEPTHGTTTGTHLESTIGGVRRLAPGECEAAAQATMAVATGRYRQ